MAQLTRNVSYVYINQLTMSGILLLNFNIGAN